MWYLISLENPDNKFVLLGGKLYVVGRRDCDILLSGDPTVSRRHAELSVSHPEANLGSVTKLPMLLLKDLSKFGTWVNKERVNGEKILSDGDEITFGSNKSLYTVVYEPMVITSSCLDNAAKKLVRQQLCILGGHMVNEWSNDCSLVVMNKISVTIKVICALISSKSVVLPGYLEQYVKHLQGTSEKPDPTGYLPVLAETQLDPNEVSFAPDSVRKTLFQGKKFVFLSPKQLKKLNQAIELGGGMPLLMETKGDDEVLLEPETIVMNCQETDLTPKGVKWAKHVKELLESHGKHMVQDAEIGYAVLYGSTEKHCNPDYTPDEDLSRLPSQSLSQADVFAAGTEISQRTQTQRVAERNTPVSKLQQLKAEAIPSKASSPGPAELRSSARHSRSPSPAKALSPDLSERQKPSRHSRSPTPAKPPSPRPSKRLKTATHSRSPSPTPVMVVKVKEEPRTQPDTATNSKKRNRLVIEEDDSDEEFSIPASNKRVKVEPETPRSKSGTTKKQKTVAVSEYAEDSDSNEDEFDKIDARMNSRRNRKTSPKPSSRSSPRVSPSRAERVSPVRQNNRNDRQSPSPHVETLSAKVKTESVAERSPCSEPESGIVQRRSDQEQRVSDIYSRAGGSRSRKRGEIKRETEENEMSAVVPLEDREDIKPVTFHGDTSGGFLTTSRPIQDQVSRNRDYEPEHDQPSSCIKVEVVSLVARKPKSKVKETEDCPDGYTTWKGKLVKNVKKFKKVHPSGHFGLPTIIGGSDLEVYVPQRSKEMDDWFRETAQADSQHASEERRAQELFDFDPSRRRGR